MEKAIDKMINLMCIASDRLDEKAEKYEPKLLWFIAFQIVVMVLKVVINGV